MINHNIIRVILIIIVNDETCNDKNSNYFSNDKNKEP